MKEVLFHSACVVLMVVPLLFIFNGVYQDGLVGRFALGAVSFTAATFVLESATSEGYDMLPQTVAAFVSFAVFMVWHLTRFHGRVLRRRGTAPCGQRNQIGCPYKVEP